MNFLLCLWKYCCDPRIINLCFFGPEIRIVKRCDRLDTLRSFCEVSIWLLVVWSTYVWFPQLRSGGSELISRATKNHGRYIETMKEKIALTLDHLAKWNHL